MSYGLATVGDFCPNSSCCDYGRHQRDQLVKNIVRFGTSPAGRQRYRCKSCGKTFVATIGTIFYKRRTPEDAIIRALLMIAEGSCISSVSRQTGHKADTISDWLTVAAEHATEIESVLLNDYQVSRAQIDGLWLYVKNKGAKKSL